MLRTPILVHGPEICRQRHIGQHDLPSSMKGQMACNNYRVIVTEIYSHDLSDKSWSFSISIASLLYSQDHLVDSMQKSRPREVRGEVPVCTWIHVPANNVSLYPTFVLPYISYEASQRQLKRAEYIQAAHEEKGLTGRLFAEMSRTIKLTAQVKLQKPIPLSARPLSACDDSGSIISNDNITFGDSNDIDNDEKALVASYLNDNAALHIRHTLDQYYYYMLECTTDRDADQVVSRRWLKRHPGARYNILMVDQLWLWTTHPRPTGHNTISSNVIGEQQSSADTGVTSGPQSNQSQRYVISSSPPRMGASHRMMRSEDDLQWLVLDRKDRKRYPIQGPEDLVARILETCCNIFDRLQDNVMLRFLQMFEKTIGSIDDNESRLFRTFQQESARLLEVNIANKYYQKRKSKLLKRMLDIREEIKLLVEVKDVRDEITIILTVLETQYTLIEQMSRKDRNCHALLDKPAVQGIVNSNIIDFEKMKLQAGTVQDKLNTLMDLKQKAANAWEAREARETAVAASKQGNTVLVFTIVTIIFLPLSFMLAFFTINISVFPKDQKNGETNWPLGKVTGRLFGVSLSVSVPLILLALNMEACSGAYNELRHDHIPRMCIWILLRWPRFDASTS
ncbi:hypothetical protein CC86DRAFT_338978 [Ophiobolus disseminans]|uniref:Cora-domain-containing protein n=1 Tax=Ophiobolus disseminans TaxID=1469910 RepID=A0A6A7AKA9_9PLEO|nr:hypothetical protein CC86DRAFT_338978 [Ophiobolus disseminans]